MRLMIARRTSEFYRLCQEEPVVQENQHIRMNQIMSVGEAEVLLRDIREGKRKPKNNYHNIDAKFKKNK